VLVVVGGQDGIVDHLVQFGGDDFLFLVFLLGLGVGDDLVLALVLGLRLGGDGAGADPAVADGLVRIELGVALRTVRRALGEVVELRLAVRANLFGTQLGIGQRR